MFSNIKEIQEANRQLGFNFFGQAEAEFFKSQVKDTIYGGRLFVTYEEDTTSGGWTVRKALDNGDIDTASEYMQFRTQGEATKVAKIIVMHHGIQQNGAIKLDHTTGRVDLSGIVIPEDAGMLSAQEMVEVKNELKRVRADSGRPWTQED